MIVKKAPNCGASSISAKTGMRAKLFSALELYRQGQSGHKMFCLMDRLFNSLYLQQKVQPQIFLQNEPGPHGSVLERPACLEVSKLGGYPRRCQIPIVLTIGRTIVAAMFVESALCHGGLISLRTVVYHTPWIFKFPPELWRLFSAFLLTGGGFNFVFDLYFSTSISNRCL